MRNEILSLALLGTGLASAPLAATTWVELGRDRNGQINSVDLDEISINGPMRSYWARYDLTGVAESDLRYAVFRNSLNCEARTVSTGYTMAYLRDGTKKPIVYATGWKPVVSGTVAELEYGFFCKK